MSHLLIIGAGGFVGSILRYVVAGWVRRMTGEVWFPLGTLAVNLAGCFLIGILGGLADSRDMFTPETRLFLTVGLLGGFTTFSTFGYETLSLFREAQIVAALSYAILHVVLGVLAAAGGYGLSQWRL